MLFRRRRRPDESAASGATGRPLDGAAPLFLIGPPRSGTTLVSKILDAHPRLLTTNETAVFLQVAQQVRRSRGGAPKHGLVYGKQYHRKWADYLDEQAPELIEGFFARLAEEKGKADLLYWGEKHPHFSDCLDFLERHWPTARYVWIVRDPRDSACSIADMRDKPFREALELWKRFVDTYEEFMAGLPPERLTSIRYEDLVADYEGETRRLLEELGVPWDDAVGDHIARFRDVDAHHLAPGVVQGLRRKVQRRDFAETAVARHLRDCSPEDLAFADDVVGAQLDRWGYPRHAVAS